jgi:hypothetical protein
MKQKYKKNFKKTILEKQNGKKKHVGKVKAGLSTSSI